MSAPTLPGTTDTRTTRVVRVRTLVLLARVGTYRAPSRRRVSPAVTAGLVLVALRCLTALALPFGTPLAAALAASRSDRR